jgi:hypothetical protein
MSKRFIKKGMLKRELHQSLFLELVEAGKIKSKKDMCKLGFCPLIFCSE